MTDGKSNVHQHRTVPEARKIRNQNVVVVGVGVSLNEVTELQVCNTPSYWLLGLCVYENAVAVVIAIHSNV